MAFVTRDQWGARRPKSVTRMATPTAGVAGHYEGSDLGAYDHSRCPGLVRGIQAQHMDRNGWVDGAYSEIVCRHGDQFELRGPGVRTAANGTNDGNARYYAVCVMIGPGDELTAEAKAGFLASVERLRRDGGAGGQIVPHNHFLPTQCPGPLAKWISQGCPLDGTQTQVALAAPPPPAPRTAPMWGVLREDGDFGALTIHALQASLNASGASPLLRVDGDFGRKSKEALQRRLNHTNGPVTDDGVVGPQTVRALQSRVGAPVDGDWGRLTTQRLQEALNGARL